MNKLKRGRWNLHNVKSSELQQSNLNNFKKKKEVWYWSPHCKVFTIEKRGAYRTYTMQRIPWRERFTPSQSNPTTNCLLGLGFKSSSGSWDALVTIWVGTIKAKVSWAWFLPLPTSRWDQAIKFSQFNCALE